MLIGERLRAIRQAKKLSQGDVEHRTGLLRAYVSRVENGHTVPAVETLEKFARALDVAMYQLFYEGDEAALLRAGKGSSYYWTCTVTLIIRVRIAPPP
jgi:transcriptional regulator with XRE-family HTH domain